MKTRHNSAPPTKRSAWFNPDPRPPTYVSAGVATAVLSFSS
jgi:hypothetical protein